MRRMGAGVAVVAILALGACGEDEAEYQRRSRAQEANPCAHTHDDFPSYNQQAQVQLNCIIELLQKTTPTTP